MLKSTKGFKVRKKDNESFTDTIEKIVYKEDQIEKLILNEIENKDEVLSFIKKHFDLHNESTIVTSTSTNFNINKLKQNEVANLINLKKINDSRFINKFLESVNAKLPYQGYYFGKVETYPNRKNAILNKYNKGFNWFVYLMDMVFNRIFPKLPITKKIYFYLTKGKGRVVSKAETFGRLYSCGFELIDEKYIDNSQFFIAKKVKEPMFDSNPTYGPIISLKRVGKNKKLFKVFKLRTMHPFSEYLQEYIYEMNSLQEGGKMKDDFRITPEGKVFRKIWLDEIPMLYNILKGDMKIVGVRPLSKHFFGLYPEELQDLRTQVKPGFIPPFYVDLPKTMEEIINSEIKYLKEYKKSPIKTDIKYFLLSFKNVLFKGARSN